MASNMNHDSKDFLDDCHVTGLNFSSVGINVVFSKRVVRRRDQILLISFYPCEFLVARNVWRDSGCRLKSFVKGF
jgi:hypothetical protein